MLDGVDDRSGHQTFEWLLRLTSEAVPQQLSVCSIPFTARIVSTAAEIHDLTAFVSSLVPEPACLPPAFSWHRSCPGTADPAWSWFHKGTGLQGFCMVESARWRESQPALFLWMILSARWSRPVQRKQNPSRVAPWRFCFAARLRSGSGSLLIALHSCGPRASRPMQGCIFAVKNTTNIWNCRELTTSF
jgi:hypothetical protein